jgi:hypothetical protein
LLKSEIEEKSILGATRIVGYKYEKVKVQSEFDLLERHIMAILDGGV